MTTICSSVFTESWLLERLKWYDSKYQRILQEQHVTQIISKDIGVGKGMVSNVFNCTICLADGSSFQVIVKIPGGALQEMQSGGEGFKDDCFAYRYHNRECQFFNDFPHLSEIIPIPHVFYSIPFSPSVPGGTGVVLLESLVGRAETADMVDGLNRHQIFAIAKDLAHFQAHFLCAEDKSWVDRYPMTVLNDTTDYEFKLDIFQKLKDYDLETFGEVVDGLLPYMSNVKVWRHTLKDAYIREGLPVVMCHGDTWINNILWDLNPDGSISNKVAAYIDWQMAHAGCLTTDIAVVLSICVKAYLQRQCQYEVLRFYYDTLGDEMAKMGRRINFGFDQVVRCYKANFIYQSMNYSCVVPSVVTSNLDLPDSVGEARLKEVFLRGKLILQQAVEFAKELPADMQPKNM
ncbi:hypothetical protein QR680_013838 [Steinernema hermaphroditum]|uniref:CHK kinase-like domain-containing protein n=1 Tax=Steinernema hermaphroditum TaxID=289476 RepID=A0AA39I6U7_9BILA|nr:hypothetical protein QR680_013838 [Steinernema hermaphroditum]